MCFGQGKGRHTTPYAARLSYLVPSPHTRADRSVRCAQRGRRTNPPHPQTPTTSLHLRTARVAQSTPIIPTSHRTTTRRREPAANIAGSRSRADVQCSHRICSAPTLLLRSDWRRGLASSDHRLLVLGLPAAGRITVRRAEGRRTKGGQHRRAHGIAACA